MTLTLHIDNHTMLDQGAPTSVTTDTKPLSVGRGRMMDWVLPDPDRRISSHHFDVEFRDGGYWLTDRSTNGTFLQGQPHRLSEAYQLKPGDRLAVGHYIISVDLGAAQVAVQGTTPQAAAMTPAPPPRAAENDPWDFGGEPLAPVDPHQKRVDPHQFDRAAEAFVPLAPSAPPVQAPGPASYAAPYPDAPAQNAPMSPAQAPAPMPPSMAPPTPGVAPMTQPEAAPSPYPPAAPAPQASAPSAAVPAMPVPTPDAFSAPPPAATPPVPAPAPATPPTSAPGPDLMRAFCEGAGIAPPDGPTQDPEALARELGRSLRHVTEETMRMMQDRASVKQFTRSGERTMRMANGNNPLKFMPDADQALAALFVAPRDGFLTGADGVASALSELRQHQMAVFAALQPALAEMLRGLSPEEIEVATDGTAKLLGGSKRGKSWDLYVERWDKTANAGEHGMLDAFLQAFARAYAEATLRAGGSHQG